MCAQVRSREKRSKERDGDEVCVCCALCRMLLLHGMVPPVGPLPSSNRLASLRFPSNRTLSAAMERVDVGFKNQSVYAPWHTLSLSLLLSLCSVTTGATRMCRTANGNGGDDRSKPLVHMDGGGCPRCKGWDFEWGGKEGGLYSLSTAIAPLPFRSYHTPLQVVKFCHQAAAQGTKRGWWWWWYGLLFFLPTESPFPPPSLAVFRSMLLLLAHPFSIPRQLSSVCVATRVQFICRGTQHTRARASQDNCLCMCECVFQCTNPFISSLFEIGPWWWWGNQRVCQKSIAELSRCAVECVPLGIQIKRKDTPLLPSPYIILVYIFTFRSTRPFFPLQFLLRKGCPAQTISNRKPSPVFFLNSPLVWCGFKNVVGSNIKAVKQRNKRGNKLF